MTVDLGIKFPVTIVFEDGSVESFQDVPDIEMNLEVFDSDLYPDCMARDANGRNLRIKVNAELILEDLEFA